MITESLNRPHVAASWHCLTISPGLVFIALITWMVLRMRLSACGIVQDRSCSSSERLLSSSRTSYIKATFSRNSIDSIRLTSPVYFALSSFWKLFCKWLLASERQGSALLFSRKIEVPGRRPAAPWHNYTTGSWSWTESFWSWSWSWQLVLYSYPNPNPNPNLYPNHNPSPNLYPYLTSPWEFILEFGDSWTGDSLNGDPWTGDSWIVTVYFSNLLYLSVIIQ